MPEGLLNPVVELTRELEQLRAERDQLRANIEAAAKDASVAEERAHQLRTALRLIADGSEHPPREIATAVLEAIPKVIALRPVVWAFAHAMEAKLAVHDLERGPRGWMGDKERGLSRASPLWLAQRRLPGEVLELARAVKGFGTTVHVLGEAADVANIAMMVADTCDAIFAPGEDRRG